VTGTLDGKIALITGGCSGLGAATVDLFEREGARVVIADLQHALGEKREANSQGAVRFVRCDVTKEEDVAAAVRFSREAFGGLDVLFNNAGPGSCDYPIADMDVGKWDAIMALLLRGPMLGIKHAVPPMRARGGGAIINTASIAALRPGISSAAYSVAKAGTIHLTRMAAVELAPYNIRVNAICPGIFPTQGVGDMLGLSREKVRECLPQIEEIFSTAQPLKRSGRASDIAQMALFLASGASSFTTGQEFVVDGGMTMMGPGSLELDRPESVLQRLSKLRKRILGVT
jgi:NAD(P)-dependent dehydrogenase (short-subunit alcohol dehydrogenase family)